MALLARASHVDTRLACDCLPSSLWDHKLRLLLSTLLTAFVWLPEGMCIGKGELRGRAPVHIEGCLQLLREGLGLDLLVLQLFCKERDLAFEVAGS